MRESLNSSFSLLSGGFIYYSSFPRQQGSSPKDLAQDLPLALPPLFHSESVQKFLPLFLWDFQRLGNPRTRRGTRRDVDVALSVRKGCCPPRASPDLPGGVTESDGTYRIATAGCGHVRLAGVSYYGPAVCWTQHTPSHPSSQVRNPEAQQC